MATCLLESHVTDDLLLEEILPFVDLLDALLPHLPSPAEGTAPRKGVLSTPLAGVKTNYPTYLEVQPTGPVRHDGGEKRTEKRALKAPDRRKAAIGVSSGPRREGRARLPPGDLYAD